MNKFISLEERNRIAKALRQNEGPLLAPSIDEAVDGKIPFSAMEKGLTIRFPFVDGMRVGGRYQVALHSLDLLAMFGQGGAIEEEGRDVTVEVPPERALLFQWYDAVLYYFYSEFEDPTSPSTPLAFEGQLYPPCVDEAVDGVIPLSVQSQGVNLRLRVTSSFTPGALVSVYWWGSSADACFVKHLTIGAGPVEDLLVPVEPAYLTSIKYGSVRIIYTVQSTTGTVISRPLRLEVAGDLTVPEPFFWIRGNYPNLLPPDGSDIISGRIKTQGMSAGDVVVLMLSIFGMGFVRRFPVRESDISGGEILYEVPVSYLPLGTKVAIWSIVDRLAGTAAGSPDLELVVFPDS
ncbi:hypothetical protein [Pseudomonas corrugata]|uniref:hypothetical protein n=3 Tax=Pseudomonas corrugata TaxID=47879 RepID=UPI001F529EFB|nr:hypothetical protein [Pseudomonas corrugata]MCI0992854.1 hypothetical protein [Pseudomonas corrugata]